MKRFTALAALVLAFLELGIFGQARAADLTCLQPDGLVVLEDESDRCNYVSLENKITHHLDLAARDRITPVLIWGEDNWVPRILGDYCTHRQVREVSVPFQVIWVKDVDTLDDDFRRSLQILGKSGHCIYRTQSLKQTSARALVGQCEAEHFLERMDELQAPVPAATDAGVDSKE